MLGLLTSRLIPVLLLFDFEINYRRKPFTVTRQLLKLAYEGDAPRRMQFYEWLT